ncbi:MAG: DNA-3-methyladenine glycosylase [Methanoregula sp.]
MQQTTLVPHPPFDFSLSVAIFSGGEPDIRTFRDGVFRQVLDTGNALVLAEVRSSGTTEDPKLALTHRSDRPVRRDEAWRAGEQVATILSITDDMDPFYRAVAGDPVLADLSVRLRGVRAPVTPTVFEALTDSIIEQQISLKAAHSIETRLIRSVGKQLDLEGITYYCYPDPEILAGTADSTFRTCGLTVRKGEYIRDVSRLILKGDLDVEGFRQEPDTEMVIEELVKIRGIGRWTAELTILRGLHRPDAFPADDVGVRRLISQFYLSGRKISTAEARTFADRWGPWKGFAAYYLEVADLLGVRPVV